VDQPSILIVSDDAEFCAVVTGRWQSERRVPAFTLVGSDLCRNPDPEAFDATIAGGLPGGALSTVCEALANTGKPLVVVCDEDRRASGLREAYPRALVLRQYEGWLDFLVLLISEVLHRSEMQARLERAEEANLYLQYKAALGSYMLEMRHGLNNALTSMLGNSELLLLESRTLSGEGREQLETVRNMGLRMHEILQRFSSLEKELGVIEREAQGDGRSKSRAAGAGW